MRGDGSDKKFKDAPMLSEYERILLLCSRVDCMFHGGEIKGIPDKTWCSHPHKKQHMNQTTCPLYQLDWKKKMEIMKK